MSYYYYIPFIPEANINYLYLFELILRADYNKETLAYDTIPYYSLQKLADTLSFSKTTLCRMLNNEEYKPFLQADKLNNKIILKNNFKGKKSIKYIRLKADEIHFLLTQKDNLLCKYFIYIKFYCGYSQKQGLKQDFTAKQFLSAIGYSSKSQAMLDKISSYNTFLSKNNFIEITKFNDSNGRIRNSYRYIHC